MRAAPLWRASCQVSIRYHDGSVYDGPYVPDGKARRADHFGCRTSADLVVLQGPCVDNHTIPLQLTGFAKMMLPTGESYEGDWVNGKRHGNGATPVMLCVLAGCWAPFTRAVGTVQAGASVGLWWD
jgi:hypothetical protein